MSRIAKNAVFDVLSSDVFSILPRAEDAALLPPTRGAIAYNLLSDPSGSIWYSNGEDWMPVMNSLLGFPFTNPPAPVLPPNGGVPIFNSGTQSWTVYALSGDVVMSNAGVATVQALDGNALGPFTVPVLNDVILWDGTKWVNGAVAVSTNPTGPAGGVLSGTYPNPGFAATGIVAGSYGSSSQVSSFTVNAGGQLTAYTPISISGLVANSIINVYVEKHLAVGPGSTLPLFFGGLSDGHNQFKIYMSWNDSNGNGGSYEFSGMVRFSGGVITAPTAGGNGATLQTVFGSTPTAGAAVLLTPGSGVVIVTFQQDTWVYNTNVHFEWVNSQGNPL